MVDNYKEVLDKNQVLESERLILRKIREEDAAGLLEWASDPETVKWLTWGGLSTLEEAHGTILNYYLTLPCFFAIEHKKDRKYIGNIDLRLIPEHDKTGTGYVINRKYWGKGYMSEALRTIISFAFETLELNRVESHHYTANPASGRVMEKAGMIKEGIAIQSEKVKGIIHDCVLYGIVRGT
ncbi:MAG: GNAT family N-acetyltransferase [Defluviitaleaceae bacterium]|nr:GNAT family N-acetyltransferase [Defluviitaleaceae bacterium]